MDTHKLTNRQQEQRLRESFISPRRVREWRDIHSQLHTVVAEQGWRLNTLPAGYEQIHQSAAGRACSATSAARATTRTGTSARAASSSGATRVRTSARSRAAG